MFEWLSKFLLTERESKPVYGFTTQKRILLAKQEERGLCNPLTNLYLKSRLANEPADFLANDETAYCRAVEEENHQHELRQAGEEDARHSGFLAMGVTHEHIEIDKCALAKDKLEEVYSRDCHSLISYPIAENKAHMVYFGKKGHKCYFFDANFIGGKLKGDCSTLIGYMAEKFEETYSDDGRKGLIGISYS